MTIERSGEPSFLMVLEDLVALMCFQNRASGFCRLDFYPERGNSLIGSVYNTDRANLVSSMHIAGKVVLCTAEKVTSCTIAILVCQVDN